MITIGPFLTRSEHPDLFDYGFAHTGYSMELVCDGELHTLPIYKDVSHMGGQYVSFDDFYFPEPPSGWPVDFRFRCVHERWTDFGRLVGISPPINEIFRALKPPILMEDFLREFRSLIPVSVNRMLGCLYKPNCELRLTGALAAEGYTAASVMSYGTSLTVDIAWSFRDDYPGWQDIAAGHMVFRPRCGRLNDGKWSRHQWRERIEDHFYNRFEALAPDKPIECFRSEEDLENLLSHFEWMPTTRHSAQEIREMRIELIRSAPHLWESPKDLAALLQKEGLYSRNTGIHQIVKFLSPLVIEASAGSSAHGKSTTTSTPGGSTRGSAQSKRPNSAKPL